jgi:hypothetical protein
MRLSGLSILMTYSSRICSLVLLLEEKILKFITNHNTASSFRFAQTSERTNENNKQTSTFSCVRAKLYGNQLFLNIIAVLVVLLDHISISQIGSRSFFKMSSDKNREFKLTSNDRCISFLKTKVRFQSKCLEFISCSFHGRP